jgi:hypothetical protein
MFLTKSDGHPHQKRCQESVTSVFVGVAARKIEFGDNLNIEFGNNLANFDS